jgi:hypothetical protein
MEVVSSKGFGLMELDTVCCWAKSQLKRKQNKYSFFFIAFEFKKAIWIR